MSRGGGENKGGNDDGEKKEEYKHKAILSDKDLKNFDEILHLDGNDGWAAAQGEIDFKYGL